ncbi:MAG: transketolase [Clostridia bacterium]|nr:transketolase [Clostridia bacterium]MBN2882645.1 transketolase [Clostridia bacterium]
MDKKTLLELKKKAVRVRKHILDEVYSAQSGHPGGSLSSTEIFTYLFQNEMKLDPANPKWMDRDRFVLSKGHCAPGLYASLAVRGFFPEKDLTGFRSIDSYLQGHPSMKDVPGVDMSTGSLGQGISTAVGMALAGKLDKKDYRVFTLLGDGEIQEGQVWEALMSAAHYKLDNLTAFIDHNGLQIDGKISDVMCPEDVVEKFRAFCWNVIQIDGHDLEAIEAAVQAAKAIKGKPTMIVAETIKGKGVSYMEDVAGWHGMAPDEELYKKAIAELDEAMALLEVE